MSKKPNIENVIVIIDASEGQDIRFSENNMYIEPTRNNDEIIFWKNRLVQQKIPYILAAIDYSTKHVDDKTGKIIHKIMRGRTLFVGESLDRDTNASK